MNRIDQLFDLLDRWRHLPAYQLERRADILFALYLPEFLSERLGIPVRAEMIPEFPVRLGTKYFHLLKLAELAGLSELPPVLDKRMQSGWARVAKDLDGIRVSEAQPEISVIYLQPCETKAGEIGFDALAAWLEKFTDPLSERFRDSLRRWAKSPAEAVDSVV